MKRFYQQEKINWKELSLEEFFEVFINIYQTIYSEYLKTEDINEKDRCCHRLIGIKKVFIKELKRRDIK